MKGLWKKVQSEKAKHEVKTVSVVHRHRYIQCITQSNNITTTCRVLRVNWRLDMTYFTNKLYLLSYYYFINNNTYYFTIDTSCLSNLYIGYVSVFRQSRVIIWELQVNYFYVLEMCKLPLFLRSTEIVWPSSRLHIIFGDGNPSALQVKLMFWFSRIATDD